MVAQNVTRQLMVHASALRWLIDRQPMVGHSNHSLVSDVCTFIWQSTVDGWTFQSLTIESLMVEMANHRPSIFGVLLLLAGEWLMVEMSNHWLLIVKVRILLAAWRVVDGWNVQPLTVNQLIIGVHMRQPSIGEWLAFWVTIVLWCVHHFQRA